MILWDIVVCYMNGNASKFCRVILNFVGVIVMRMVMRMVIPICDG